VQNATGGLKNRNGAGMAIQTITEIMEESLQKSRNFRTFDRFLRMLVA